MEAQRVDMFLSVNNKYFEDYQLIAIREQLLQLDEDKFSRLSLCGFKDPTTTLIISILGGGLGIDRFYIGDTGLGIGKLLTGGGCGIWTIVDWFLIMGATKKKNLEKLQQMLLY